MMSMQEANPVALFPTTLPFIHTQASLRRKIGRKSALIQILALDEQGQRRRHYDSEVRYGLYVLKDSEWHLAEVYNELSDARNAGNRIKRGL
jgi:hypothetical protein